MIYGSVCSGIEAATVAWHPLGWKAAFYSEIEAFPSAVLAHHYPTVPNYGDMTKFKEWPDAKLDVLVGGTPCQSFSIAGLRKGLDDPRGNLMLTYLAIADGYCPTWVVWENVPGVLSSNGGKDFGALLGGLAELGYGFAYRILDAQYIGVPQRRRRVFVVGYLGDWRRAAAVLFERQSLSGDSPPRRKTRETVAGTIGARTGRSIGAQDAACGYMIAHTGSHITGALTARGARNMGQANDDVDGHKLICVATGKAGAEMAVDMSPTLSCNHEAPIVTVPTLTSNGDAHGGFRDEKELVPTYGIPGNWIGRKPENGGNAVEPMHDLCPNLTGTDRHAVSKAMQVRRLTPRECERLQGFPDDYSLIQIRGKPAADGPRYKALGNSMAVPVMNWIGQRIQMVSDL